MWKKWSGVVLLVVGVACSALGWGIEPGDTAPPTLVPYPLAAATSPTSVPYPVETPGPPTDAASPTAVPTEAPGPPEAIALLQPGPGSRLTSPLHVEGLADPTFEQTLVVRVVASGSLEGETVLAIVPVQIQADIGQRGAFSVDIPFEIAGEMHAAVQVFATSARDGGITHLAMAYVLLAGSGAQDVRVSEETTERIVIYTPGLGGVVSGGVAHVEGFGLASFEQTLVVEVVDQDGQVIGIQPVIVSAPDWGIPGPFVADVAYTLSAAGPGRIVVRDPSPAFAGDVHLTSVEVMVQP